MGGRGGKGCGGREEKGVGGGGEERGKGTGEGGHEEGEKTSGLEKRCSVMFNLEP